jgi:hypothetical protein
MIGLNSDPTPKIDDLITAKWLPFTKANEEYMDIGENLVPKRKILDGRLDVWQSFIDRFNPNRFS